MLLPCWLARSCTLNTVKDRNTALDETLHGFLSENYKPACAHTVLTAAGILSKRCSCFLFGHHTDLVQLSIARALSMRLTGGQVSRNMIKSPRWLGTDDIKSVFFFRGSLWAHLLQISFPIGAEDAGEGCLAQFLVRARQHQHSLLAKTCSKWTPVSVENWLAFRSYRKQLCTLHLVTFESTFGNVS